jgi:hypothetical protein
MEDFQKRVVAEKEELDSKIEKLSTFIHGPIYAKLPEDERMRMMRQFCHMKDYSNVLGERIAVFNQKQTA